MDIQGDKFGDTLYMGMCVFSLDEICCVLMFYCVLNNNTFKLLLPTDFLHSQGYYTNTVLEQEFATILLL